jgi:hypothetical protein
MFPVQWMPDGTRLYAGQKTYATGVLDLAVTPQGLSINRLINWRTASGFRIYGTRAFLDDGRVFSLDGAVAILGRFTDYDNPYWARAEAINNGKAFSLGDHLENGPFLRWPAIVAFDADTFVTIDSIVFDDDALFAGGYVMVWGSDGIATYGANGLLVAHGSFAAAGGADRLSGPPDGRRRLRAREHRPAPTMRSTGARSVSGRTTRSPTDAVTLCHHHGNPTSAPINCSNSIRRPARCCARLYVGSEPDNLAVSDDCSKIYVGLRESNAVTAFVQRTSRSKRDSDDLRSRHISLSWRTARRFQWRQDSRMLSRLRRPKPLIFAAIEPSAWACSTAPSSVR